MYDEEIMGLVGGALGLGSGVSKGALELDFLGLWALVLFRRATYSPGAMGWLATATTLGTLSWVRIFAAFYHLPTHLCTVSDG